MRALLCFVAGISPLATTAYAAPDLACYAITNLPDSSYVQADSALVPRLGIANLGEEPEDTFWVRFMAIDKEQGDTVLVDSVLVDHLDAYPDSLEVELSEWTPEGICRPLDWGLPIVEYELLGIACLAEDESLENDTARSNVTCLWVHDVGITDLVVDPPDYPRPGETITFTATVENFGFNEEYAVPVRCEVRDRDSGDVLLWVNIQQLAFIDWRGNDTANPYTCDITFPTYTLANDHWQKVEVRTELTSDMCPEDDWVHRDITPPDVAEVPPVLPSIFSLEVSGDRTFTGLAVKFGVPHKCRVKLDVYDASGRWIKTLENNLLVAGTYSRTWDGRDGKGSKVAAGVYYIRMEAADFAANKKFVLVR